MGAKTAEQLKVRRPTVKCDICGRKFLNTQALKSHHSFLHTGVIRGSPNPYKRDPLLQQVDTRQIKKKLVPVSMLKRVNAPTTTTTKSADNSDVREKNTDLAGKKANTPSNLANLSNKQANLSIKQANLLLKHTPRKHVNILSKSENASDTKLTKKPEFECPVCDARFPVYLSAFRHIQQNHCVNESGEKVTATSPHLVKPIRIEECATCNAEIRSTERHNCPKRPARMDLYTCLGCNQVFNGLVLFQQHVKGMHDEGAQNYFFPNREEFRGWKRELERQSSLEYVRLNTHQSKEMYHCTYQPSKQSADTHLCPSSITVRDYSQGVHVYYYTEHYGHPNQHVALEKYNQYSISTYFREAEELKDKTVAEDSELYYQFKKMITCIDHDAMSTDEITLKKLLGKAFEMTTILKEFEGGHTSPLVSKNLSDAQISKTLENLKPNTPNPVKRKLSPSTKVKKVEAKKVKKGSQSVEKIVEDENDVTTIITRSSPSLNKSVAFKTTKKDEEEDEVRNPQTLLQSPPSFNDSYKHFVDQNFKSVSNTSTPRVKNITKKKEVVKTKMGQFKSKPSTPPKLKESPKSLPKEAFEKAEDKEPSTPKAWKKVPDIKYEVKEQENDCNILILKI